MQPQAPQPVKLIIGILYTDDALLANALDLLKPELGDIDYQSPVYEFNISEYYFAEMGHPIQRMFISFGRLVNPKELAPIKIQTNAIEDQLAVQSNRKVNLDPGYLDFDKFVLASAKYNGQKVYLDLGIWADLTLRYEKGNFYPFPWSFPDFKRGLYNAAFQRMRELYKADLKKKRGDR
ncbi:DUF4416 family protein [candidate division KSB1 bacterium]|nr:DUF4416 family protein [candidate division KSB1 bacterium]